MADSKAYIAREARALMRSLPKNSRLAFTDDDTTSSNGNGKGPSKEVTSGDQKSTKVDQADPSKPPVNGPATNGEGDGPTVPEPGRKSPEEMSKSPEEILEEGTGEEGQAQARKLVPGVIDEAKWEQAKERVFSEFGYDESNPRYWKAVQLIYEKITEGTAEL